MPSETTEKIVYVKTEDGLTLEGLMLQPLGQSAPTETIIWFHGLHQKFSEMEYVNIGRQLAARGFRFITANLRSHDFGTWPRASGWACTAAGGFSGRTKRSPARRSRRSSSADD